VCVCVCVRANVGCMLSMGAHFEGYGSMLSHLSAHKQQAVMHLVVMSSKPSRNYGKVIISHRRVGRLLPLYTFKFHFFPQFFKLDL